MSHVEGKRIADRTDWNRPITKQQTHRENITGPLHERPVTPTRKREGSRRPRVNHQKSSSQYADAEEKTQEQQQKEIRAKAAEVRASLLRANAEKEYRKLPGWSIEDERRRQQEARILDYEKNRGRTSFSQKPTSAGVKAAHRTNSSAEIVYYNKYIA